jgi:membrane protease YdiL (CAAX protease family)
LNDQRPTQVNLFWKLAAFAGITLGGVVLGLLVAVVFTLAAPGLEPDLPLLAVSAGGVLAASWTCLRLFDGRSITAVGIGFDRPWGRQLSVGLVIGGAICLATWSLSILTPWADTRWPGEPPGTWLGLVYGAVVCLLVATFEELLCRGYAFQMLARRNMILAFVLTGLLFVAIHLPNPGGQSPVAILNIALGHVMFAAFYLRARSLWLPIGVHAAFNYVEIHIVGVSLGASDDSPSALETALEANVWAGDEFGLLGGLAATLCVAITTIAVWRGWKQQHPASDLLRRTTETQGQPGDTVAP